MIRAITIKLDSNFAETVNKILSELKDNEKVISQETVVDASGISFLVIIIENFSHKKILLG